MFQAVEVTWSRSLASGWRRTLKRCWSCSVPKAGSQLMCCCEHRSGDTTGHSETVTPVPSHSIFAVSTVLCTVINLNDDLYLV